MTKIEPDAVTFSALTWDGGAEASGRIVGTLNRVTGAAEITARKYGDAAPFFWTMSLGCKRASTIF